MIQSIEVKNNDRTSRTRDSIVVTALTCLRVDLLLPGSTPDRAVFAHTSHDTVWCSDSRLIDQRGHRTPPPIYTTRQKCCTPPSLPPQPRLARWKQRCRSRRLARRSMARSRAVPNTRCTPASGSTIAAERPLFKATPTGRQVCTACRRRRRRYRRTCTSQVQRMSPRRRSRTPRPMRQALLLIPVFKAPTP